MFFSLWHRFLFHLQLHSTHTKDEQPQNFCGSHTSIARMRWRIFSGLSSTFQSKISRDRNDVERIGGILEIELMRVAIMKTRIIFLLLVILPLLCHGLEFCDRKLQDKYCNAPYGGDMHTACRFCGIGPHCPQKRPIARGLTDPQLKDEIVKRHNEYRKTVRKTRKSARCIPDLR